VTGKTPDPTALAWRFSPVSNLRREQVTPEDELRVLIATDVLSEGQNLQDAAIVVNYDLPWAIIRLIQRAGRVDRIGQRASEILCYGFWPADGVERLIQLRSRLHQRLRENAEVVGTDEAFFEEESSATRLLDLYNEKAGSLDDEGDREVDLVSYAYQIWKNATDANPALREIIPRLPNSVHATKAAPLPASPRSEPGGGGETEGVPGVLVYTCTTGGTSGLAWIDAEGHSVTESQFTVLRAAECALDTPALPRQEAHHALVAAGAQHIVTERPARGGQLGRPSGARFRTYERLKAHVAYLQTTFFAHEAAQVSEALDALFRYPLRESARDTLNRQLRSGITDEDLAHLVTMLHQEDRLCIIQDEEQPEELQIICSLGLVPGAPQE